MNFQLTDICLLVPDIQRSLAFYRDQLGLTVKRLDIGFAEFESHGGANVALWETNNFAAHIGPVLNGTGHRVMGAIELASAEEFAEVYAELERRGVPFIRPVADWPWGARAAYFTDPDGYLWEIYTWVNQPYTW